jgi:hypothetical protein
VDLLGSDELTTGDRPQYEPALRLAIGAAILTLVLALYARSVAPDPAATPLVDPDGRLYYLLALFAVVGFCVAIERVVPMGDSHSPGWIMPALTLTGAFMLAGVYHRWPVVLSLPLLAGSGVFASLLVRHYRASDDEATRSSARLAQLVLTLGVVLVLFSMIVLHRAGLAFSVLGMGATAGLALYPLLDEERASPVRRAVYSAAVALGIAEIAAALEYWRIEGWYGGALVAAVFYGLARVVDGHLRSEVTRPFLVQHVGTATLLVVTFAYLADG